MTPSLTSARLARVILGYLTLNIAIITLAPFRFSATPINGLTSIIEGRDALLNIALFIPLGFVYQLSREDRAQPRWLPAFGAGFLVSALIELAQVFAPGRYPSAADLGTNALGASLGAWIASLAVQRTDGTQTVRAFALDLPLIGLTYLLLPALWLTGLSAPEGGLTTVLLPVSSAAWIMGSVHASYGGTDATPHADSSRLLRLWGGAALFLAVGLAPAAWADAQLLLWGAILVVGLIALRLLAPAAWIVGLTPDGNISRRFEGPTLRVALGPLVAFVGVLSVLPIAGPFGAWRVTWSLTPATDVPSDAALFRAMALLASYTAIGYAIAAMQGRRMEAMRGLAMRALGWTLLLAAPLEWMRGWGTTTAASATMLALASTASVLGATMYQLQLRHVQALLGRR